MHSRAGVAFALLIASAGCNPYEQFSGEFYAGPVDPAEFPAAYLGTGGDPKFGGGQFQAVQAFAHDRPAPYYLFPVPDGVDPLLLRDDTAPVPVSSPRVYAFDPSPPDRAFPPPGMARCVPPKGYLYDEQRDAYRLDEQGNIFTVLPDLAPDSYVPVVAEVPVTSAGEPCQDPKSEANLVTRDDVHVPLMAPPDPSPPGTKPTGISDDFYLAWAIIDPSADVAFPDGSHDPETGLGPQKWGWYNHFLVAYLDGGYIPTTIDITPGQNGAPDEKVIHAKPQLLYVPDTAVDPETGNPAPNDVGLGHDVLEHPRGESGYSPICRVRRFTPPDPAALPTRVEDIDLKTVAPEDAPVYVYCLGAG